MATGIVRFYNDAKGFGLITPDTGGPALFMAAAELKGGVKKVKASQRVEYDVFVGPQGTCATNIKLG